MAASHNAGPKWTCGFGSQWHPGSDGSPARSHRSASRASDLRTWLPKAGHLGHSRDSREKALPNRERANPRPSLGESSGATLPKSNAETLWANHQQQRGEGRVQAPPPSLRRPRNPSAKIARVQSVAKQRRGACPPGPLPSALSRPSAASGGAPFIDVSPLGESGFAGAGAGRGRIPASGRGGGRPCRVHVTHAPLAWALGQRAPGRAPCTVWPSANRSAFS